MSEENSSGARSSRGPPVWDGTKERWPRFRRQFVAYCRLKKCHVALVEGGEVELPSSETDDVSGEANKAAREALQRNYDAMSYLTLALDDDSLVPYLSKGETDEYPGGLAHLVWSALRKKLEPKDGLSQIELIRKLFALEVSKDGDPGDIFDQVRTIEGRYNTPTRKMGEELKMAAVVIQAGEQYDDVIASEQRSRGERLTCNDLEEAMMALYRVKQHVKDPDSNDIDMETGLATWIANVEDGHIICRNCQGRGHKAAECPSKSKGRSVKAEDLQQFQGVCHNCKKRGHKAKDCMEKKTEEAAGIEVML